MTLQDMDFWNSEYRPSPGSGIALAAAGIVTSVMIAFGHAQGTLDMADTIGWLIAGSGVMLALVELSRSR